MQDVSPIREPAAENPLLPDSAFVDNIEENKHEQAYSEPLPANQRQVVCQEDSDNSSSDDNINQLGISAQSSGQPNMRCGICGLACTWKNWERHFDTFHDVLG